MSMLEWCCTGASCIVCNSLCGVEILFSLFRDWCRSRYSNHFNYSARIIIFNCGSRVII